MAIVRFSAAGDVLLCSSAIDALAAAWPHVPLVLVTHARFAPLLAHHPRLAAVEPLPPGGSLRKLSARLRQRHGVDSVLDLHASWRSRLLALWLRPRRHARWHKRDWSEWARVVLGQGRYRPRLPMARRLHDAVEALVGRVLPQVAFALPGLPNLAEARDKGPRPAARIGLSPGAGWASKRWPAERYAAVARALRLAGHEVAVFGSAAERALTSAVVAGAPGAKDLGGALDWPGTYAEVAQLDAFVAGDTGPMHLARGLGVPVVALFTSTPAEQFDLQGHAPLRAQTPCSPCSFYGRSACPRGHAACLQDITPAQVLAAVDLVLAKSPR